MKVIVDTTYGRFVFGPNWVQSPPFGRPEYVLTGLTKEQVQAIKNIRNAD